MQDDKSRHRQMKRDLKKAGTRKLRRQLGRQLATDPEGAAEADYDHGRDTTAHLNGNDHDRTRRRTEEADEGDSC
ncbi:MAG: hypothetical protein K2W96_11710 [Gemmataceae bacterium]|nr:hypothetical protein [Gemmataceae bacterium]